MPTPLVEVGGGSLLDLLSAAGPITRSASGSHDQSLNLLLDTFTVTIGEFRNCHLSRPNSKARTQIYNPEWHQCSQIVQIVWAQKLAGDNIYNEIYMTPFSCLGRPSECSKFFHLKFQHFPYSEVFFHFFWNAFFFFSVINVPKLCSSLMVGADNVHLLTTDDYSPHLRTANLNPPFGTIIIELILLMKMLMATVHI